MVSCGTHPSSFGADRAGCGSPSRARPGAIVCALHVRSLSTHATRTSMGTAKPVVHVWYRPRDLNLRLEPATHPLHRPQATAFSSLLLHIYRSRLRD